MIWLVVDQAFRRSALTVRPPIRRSGVRVQTGVEHPKPRRRRPTVVVGEGEKVPAAARGAGIPRGTGSQLGMRRLVTASRSTLGGSCRRAARRRRRRRRSPQTPRAGLEPRERRETGAHGAALVRRHDDGESATHVAKASYLRQHLGSGTEGHLLARRCSHSVRSQKSRTNSRLCVATTSARGSILVSRKNWSQRSWNCLSPALNASSIRTISLSTCIGDRESEPRPHASRQGAELRLDEALELGPLQDVREALPDRSPAQAADGAVEIDVVRDRELLDHAGAEPGEERHLAVDLDAPRRRRVESGDRLQQGGLARAVRADDPDDLAGARFEVDPVERSEAISIDAPRDGTGRATIERASADASAPRTP